MFIGAGLELYIVSAHLRVARKNIGKQVIFGVAEMWGAVNVGNGGGDVSFHGFYYIIFRCIIKA